MHLMATLSLSMYLVTCRNTRTSGVAAQTRLEVAHRAQVEDRAGATQESAFPPA